jgi:hypothetical protein
MADLTDAHTRTQCQTLLNMVGATNWHHIATCAYNIARKHRLVPDASELSNVNKIAMFNTLSKVSNYFTTIITLTHPMQSEAYMAEIRALVKNSEPSPKSKKKAKSRRPSLVPAPRDATPSKRPTIHSPTTRDRLILIAEQREKVLAESVSQLLLFPLRSS